MTHQAPKTPQEHLLIKIGTSTQGISLILIGIKVLGFVEKQVLAYYFGTGYQVDAYFVGFALMITFWDFLRGIMDPSYLPTLIQYRAAVGEAKSWEFTSVVLNLMSLVFAACIGVALIFTPQLVALVAPGFAGERLAVAIGITRLMLTGAGFFAVAILTGLTLNSYKRFLLAVTDDVVFKISGLLGLLILARYIGIYGLGWGIALGSWVAPFIHLIGLRRHLPQYRWSLNLRLDPLRKMFRLMLPLLVGTLCIEGRRIIDNLFASTLRVGRVSALAFGYKLIEVAYVAIAEPLATVVLPYFSDLALENDQARLTETLMTTLRVVVVIFTPLSVCLFALRYPVVRLLFERGEFDAASTQLTVTALTFYALGLVSFALDVILLRFYFSLSDTVTPAIMEVVTIALHTGLIAVLIGTMDHRSIALAFTLSKTLKVIILFGLLKTKLSDLQRAENLRFLGKIAIAVGVTVLALAGYKGLVLAQGELTGFVSMALFIVTSGSLGILIFLGTAVILRVQEVHLVYRAIRAFVVQLFQKIADLVRSDS
ncbi:oligosaccharide flippase family protein [candidate division KSB3 bacterium]|uniref:Oligosaccharide flippase family protein n=1 Tax=candidate division KSB3 bacterium TaxID=2044937 RepID=A0A9D5JUE9_9BACT|nr:oligosaccharide flippase family protein [candidate division KSB3 bacterium]MBD3324443.1 oligosaccharide flippase family protein [candidate division KSB3 bacterium]